MIDLKCKKCGGTLVFEPGATVAECEYCMSRVTLPRLDNDKKNNMIERAEYFRRQFEYDKAISIYEQILHEDSSDAEIYWLMVLCRFGIEYVKDPSSGRRIPTINRVQYTFVTSDDNYLSALRYADSAQKAQYTEDALEIEKIQKEILKISKEEKPFDIFICYKETDNAGRRTMDSVLANDMYHQLTQEGYKVFFSRITLEDKIGSAYEPVIFAALNSAKIMIAVGTCKEHYEAVWVKNEWKRYMALIHAGAKKTLIPAYRDMNPYDLPEDFAYLQAQDMGKLGFMQDLLHGIRKILSENETPAAKQEPVQKTKASPSTENLIRRAFLLLEDGESKKAEELSEQVLNIDCENAQAYLVKLLIDMGVKTQKQLSDCVKSFEENPNYKKILRFGNAELIESLKKSLDDIQDIGENCEKGIRRAFLLLKYGDSYKAEELSEQILSINSKKAQAYLIKLLIDMKVKAPEQLSDCKTSFEENPNYRKILRFGNAELIESLKKSLLDINEKIIKKQYEYEILDDGTVKIKKYIATESSVIIPEKIRKRIVTTIGEEAFKDCTSLTSVTIGNSVTSIGYSAFEACKSLTSITIPDSVTSIGSKAFFSCDSLTSVTIGNSVTSIGSWAFQACTALTSVTIGNSVTSIGSSAFAHCYSLTSVTVPDSVTYIGDHAFVYCKSLTSVTIGNSVTTIGDQAFYSCKSLTSVTIPKSVTIIGNEAFYGCSCLTVTLLKKVKKARIDAFLGCKVKKKYGLFGF